MSSYTVEELRAQGWDDQRIQDWGDESGKVQGIGERKDKAKLPSDFTGKPTSAQEAPNEVKRPDEGIRVEEGMVRVGNVGADRSSLGLDVKKYDSGGGALLYDRKTGDLYRASEWEGQVTKGNNIWGLVDSKTGDLFTGFILPTGDDATGESTFQMSKDPGYQARKYGGVNPMLAFGEAPKDPAEFRKWAATRYEAGARQQAASYVYDAESKRFKNSSGQTLKYGQFGSMSYKDWVAAGKPKTVSGVKLFSGDTADEDYAQLSAVPEDRVRSDFMLTGMHSKRPHFFMEKSFGKDGAKWLPRLMEVGGVAAKAIPGWGTAIGMGVSAWARALDTYQKTGSSEMGFRSFHSSLLSQGLSPQGGGGNWWQSILGGAAKGGLNGAVSYSLDRLIVQERGLSGQEDEIGRAATRGSISGAIGGGANWLGGGYGAGAASGIQAAGGVVGSYASNYYNNRNNPSGERDMTGGEMLESAVVAGASGALQKPEARRPFSWSGSVRNPDGTSTRTWVGADSLWRSFGAWQAARSQPVSAGGFQLTAEPGTDAEAAARWYAAGGLENLPPMPPEALSSRRSGAIR